MNSKSKLEKINKKLVDLTEEIVIMEDLEYNILKRENAKNLMKRYMKELKKKDKKRLIREIVICVKI